MTAIAPTDEVPSVLAILMLPMVDGAEPSFNPMQYTVSRVKSFTLLHALVKAAVTMIDVLYAFDKERDEIEGRVGSCVGAYVGVAVGE